MKIVNMKWGYDGGGFACGPIEGNSIAEVMVFADGKSKFCIISSNGEGIDVRLSDVSLFDLMINMMSEDADFYSEFEKIQKLSESDFAFACGEDAPSEIVISKYKDLIAVTAAALKHYMTTPLEDEVSPEEFMEDYIDDDGNLINIPDIEDVFDYDDEWDEEEEDE